MSSTTRVHEPVLFTRNSGWDCRRIKCQTTHINRTGFPSSDLGLRLRKERDMNTIRLIYLGMAAIGIAAYLTATPVHLSGQQNIAMTIDADATGRVDTCAN